MMSKTTKTYVDISPLLSKGRPNRFVKDPYGFDAAIAAGSSVSSGARNASDSIELELRAKKAWEVALAPGKTLPMQMFMAWMSGSGVSIFSIIIMGMIFMTPLKSIMSVHASFAPLERLGKGGNVAVDLSMQKAAFIAINIGGVLFGVYRLSIMGLLPTATSDWLAFVPFKHYLELSA